MTDIHSHVIWRMDDGAKRHAETVELCRIAEQSGTDTLFLTPHLMYWEEAEFLYDQREERVAELENILEYEGINLRLVKGFEILWTIVGILSVIPPGQIATQFATRSSYRDRKRNIYIAPVENPIMCADSIPRISINILIISAIESIE